MQARTKTRIRSVITGALLVPALILLLLPFLPYPADHDTLMKIRFRAEDSRVTHVLTVPETAGVCSEIRAAISDRDPASGAYTKVACN
jgi:hypothetical protein